MRVGRTGVRNTSGEASVITSDPPLMARVPAVVTESIGNYCQAEANRTLSHMLGNIMLFQTPPINQVQQIIISLTEKKEEPKEPTLEAKIASNYYTCTTLQWVRADNATCLDKPPIPTEIPITSPQNTPQPIQSVADSSSRFDFGWCTYYADQQRPNIHAHGNAADWVKYTNSNKPKPGAVAVNTWAAGGLGHVGIVLEIRGDKVLVRSMNYQQFGVITDDWTDASYWAGYIL